MGEERALEWWSQRESQALRGSAGRAQEGAQFQGQRRSVAEPTGHSGVHIVPREASKPLSLAAELRAWEG